MFWPWPRPICPAHGDRHHDQRIILEFDVSRGGGYGSMRNIPRTFLQTKSINESSLTVTQKKRAVLNMEGSHTGLNLKIMPILFIQTQKSQVQKSKKFFLVRVLSTWRVGGDCPAPHQKIIRYLPFLIHLAVTLKVGEKSGVRQWLGHHALFGIPSDILI